MSLTKIVNGRRVELSAEEEQAVIDKWSAPRTAEEWMRVIAGVRYDQEVAGTTFVHSDGNTYGVATDRQSQAMVTGARLSVEDAPDLVLDWKTAQGFSPVDATDIKALATAVRSHVETCFSREQELQAKVEDGTITQDALEEGWPA